MKATVFYSWQSDTRAAANRTLIQDALENAVGDIAADGSIGVEPVVDRDTQNVAGSPDIGATILSKIRAADIVVADVTIINAGKGTRPTPNPNVMIEVGYALAAHSESQIILVQNTAFGAPDALPFDLRQKRVICYESPEDAGDRATPRRELERTLRKAIEAILIERSRRSAPANPVELSMRFKTHTRSQDLHEYRLLVTIRNNGTKRITEWQADVEVPRPLLTKEAARAGAVNRSNKERTVRRFTEETDGPLFPGDVKTLEIRYQVNRPVFEKQNQVLDQVIRAQLFAHGELLGAIEKPARELQEF